MGKAIKDRVLAATGCSLIKIREELGKWKHTRVNLLNLW